MPKGTSHKPQVMLDLYKLPTQAGVPQPEEPLRVHEYGTCSRRGICWCWHDHWQLRYNVIHIRKRGRMLTCDFFLTCMLKFQVHVDMYLRVCRSAFLTLCNTVW
jgi:hypothetical protein